MNKLLLCSLVFLLLALCTTGVYSVWNPMSPCKVARATWYPIYRNKTTNIPQGTCSFGPVMDDLNPIFKSGYLSAPDDETYNAAIKYITNGGLGWACGECFEIYGAKGMIRVMAADICDFGHQSNCGGMENHDHQDFNIDESVWAKIYTDIAGGQTTINYRMVACDTLNKNVSLYFDASPNLWWFRIFFYNFRVGIRGAQILQNGVWKNLVRDYVNGFTWENSGAVQVPFKIRVKNIYGNWTAFPQSFTEASLVAGARYKSNFQFALPPAGYGGSSAPLCKWSGPQPVIYDNALRSLANIAWVDWGSWATTVDYAATTGCYSGKCIQATGFSSASGIQIANPNSFPNTFFTKLTFWAKVSSGSIQLKLMWDCVSSSSNLYTVPQELTTTWQQFTVLTSSWTISENCFKVLKIIGGNSSSSPVTLYLDNIILGGAAAGTGTMTGWTQCATFTDSTTCAQHFWCKWNSATSVCFNNVS